MSPGSDKIKLKLNTTKAEIMATSTAKHHTLIWMDLEMTGLNPDVDVILEIATIITDDELNVVDKATPLVIHQSDHTLNQMDEWNQTHHGRSGLIDKVRSSTLNTEDAETRTLDFIKQYIKPSTGILAGNSIWQDRRFIIKHMPQLDQYMHYRMLDVSTVKILKGLWYPDLGKDFKKKESHRALDDIEESIAELSHYRQLLCERPT